MGNGHPAEDGKGDDGAGPLRDAQDMIPVIDEERCEGRQARSLGPTLFARVDGIGLTPPTMIERATGAIPGRHSVRLEPKD